MNFVTLSFKFSSSKLLQNKPQATMVFSFSLKLCFLEDLFIFKKSINIQLASEITQTFAVCKLHIRIQVHRYILKVQSRKLNKVLPFKLAKHQHQQSNFLNNADSSHYYLPSPLALAASIMLKFQRPHQKLRGHHNNSLCFLHMYHKPAFSP